MRSFGNGKMNPAKLRKFIGQTTSVKKTTDPERKKTANPEYKRSGNSQVDTPVSRRTTLAS